MSSGTLAQSEIPALPLRIVLSSAHNACLGPFCRPPPFGPVGRSIRAAVIMASESIETLTEEPASLPDCELTEVLQRVLGDRIHREAGFETRFFVGHATLEGFTETWEIGAVAIRDTMAIL